MTPSRSSLRSIPRALRAYSVVLLALGLLAPQAAQAAHCGRYVLSNARFEQDLARLVSGDEATAEPGASPAMPPPPAPPCVGVLCSGLPAAPASPVATPVPLGEHWLCLAAVVAVPLPGSFLVVRDQTEAQPILRGLAVFHPPRSAAPTA